MVATTDELKESISDFIALLKPHIRVDAAVLYGSYAHGTPHEDSDIDLAIISPDFEGMNISERQRILSRLTFQRRDRRVEAMGYPSSEYHSPGRHSFLREIIATGRKVYP